MEWEKRKHIKFKFQTLLSRIMKQNKIKLFLFTTIISINILCICVADMHGGSVNIDPGHLKTEKSVRGPFTLPPEVNFLKKAQEAANAYSEAGEWEKGMIASSVKGIFRSNVRSMANINHVWIETGNWVGEEQVTGIYKDRVVLKGKNGVKRTLFLQEEKAELKFSTRIMLKTKEKK